MKATSIPITIIMAALALTACGPGSAAGNPGNSGKNPTPAASSTPFPSATSDPCAPANLPAAVQKVDELTRQFDDDTAIIDNSISGKAITPDALAGDISTLQTIRRAAQDQDVPTCLQTLRDLQVTHMNTVIQYFLLVLGHGDPKVIAQEVQQDGQLRQNYNVEKGLVLGFLKLSTFTPTAPITGTPPTASATPKP
jgi:hypothetical protein